MPPWWVRSDGTSHWLPRRSEPLAAGFWWSPYGLGRAGVPYALGRVSGGERSPAAEVAGFFGGER